MARRGQKPVGGLLPKFLGAGVRGQSPSAGIVRRRPTGTVVSPITPTNVTGINLWVKADVNVDKDPGTTFLNPATTTGDVVSAWQDQSGDGNHLNNAGADSAKPTYKTSDINSLPAVFFGDYNRRLTTAMPTVSDFTLKSAIKLTTLAATRGLFGGPNNQSRILLNSSTSVSFRNSTGTTVTFAVGELPVDSYAIFAFDSNADTIRNYLNGVLNGTSGAITGSWNFTQLGSDTNGERVLEGYIAELVFYDNVLSDANRNGVTKYMANRYGLTVTF